MEPRESRPMDPISTPVNDLGLTLSPGSQPAQLDPSHPNKEDDLASLFDGEDSGLFTDFAESSSQPSEGNDFSSLFSQNASDTTPDSSKNATELNDLAAFFGLEDDFDPFTDFSKLAAPPSSNRADQAHPSTKKRTSEQAFGTDHEKSSTKRVNCNLSNVSPLGYDTASSPYKQLATQASPGSTSSSRKRSHDQVQTGLGGNFKKGCRRESRGLTSQGEMLGVSRASSHIRSTAPISVGSSPTPANDETLSAHFTFSSDIQSRFGLTQESSDRLSAVEAFCHGSSTSKHISPYAPVDKSLSTASLQSESGSQTDLIEDLRRRLDSSRRRLDTVTTERDEARAALSTYEHVNPHTSQLRIHELEAEVQKLRQTASNHRRRMDKANTELGEWRRQYTNLATTYNSLLRDYHHLQAMMVSRPPHSGSAMEATVTAALNVPRDSTSSLLVTTSAASSPVSPPSITSPSRISQHDIRSERLPSHACGSPFEGRSLGLPPPPPGHPSPDLITPSSTLSAHRGQGSATSLEQPDPLLPGATCTTPASPSLAARHAADSSTTATIADAVVGPEKRRPVAAPTVPPKDVPVIDLTVDSDTEVSPQGPNSLFRPALTQDPSPLTRFRRSLRAKSFDWLRNSNSLENDSVLAGRMCKSLNSAQRQAELGDKFVHVNLNECYRLVQSQQHVRRALGGPLAPLPGGHPSDVAQSAVAATVTTGNTCAAAPAPRAVAESNTVTNGDTPASPYHVTDDEFALMLEESLARGKTPE
ncbi:hypothetical protein N7539_004285 [Penicillium diatomitis]|uniref:Uncharacterized protein n=1 Tax=Penicillium diatomitis TaxID=2819901 RepID=A0A9W9XDJ4_9EURO|nr:uncharacterized protein N7539_004285 [Penicillium diatomitis]KAJ5489395.1 hypothetical protein N7539_004285 [Penicillium diatomitis]